MHDGGIGDDARATGGPTNIFTTEAPTLTAACRRRRMWTISTAWTSSISR